MNSLYFKKIRYKNLISSGNQWTEIDLTSHSLTLIVGDNGAGKSTFIDAVCFVLFKKPFRKVKLPQLVNSITKKEALIEVEFSVKGHEYRVVRGIKPNVFEIWRDGVLLNQPGATVDYQEILERQILRTNFKTFTQIAILGSASYVPFMQLKNHERKEIVDDIYDTRIITIMASLLKDKLVASERELERLESERVLLEQKLEMSQDHQVDRAEEKQKQIEVKTAEIEQVMVARASLEEMIERLRTERNSLTPLLEEERAKDLKIKELADIQRKIEVNSFNIEKEIKFLQDHPDCPTCKQNIDPTFKLTVITDRENKLNEIAVGLQQLNDKMNEIAESRDSLSYARKRCNEVETEIIVLGHRIQTQNQRFNSLDKELSALENDVQEIIDESTLVELESKIKEQKRIHADLVTQREMMQYVGVLLKDTGIKSKIVKKYSGTFNQLVNSYLAKLDFFVDFHLDENFEETIRSRGRDTFSYESFSEGEKLRIDLAVMFAWRDIARMRVSLNTNLLVMDEIFDGSMDTLGKQELLSIMRGVIEDNNTFVISHQADTISDQFDRTLKFTKRKGFSHLDVR